MEFECRYARFNRLNRGQACRVSRNFSGPARKAGAIFPQGLPRGNSLNIWPMQ